MYINGQVVADVTTVIVYITISILAVYPVVYIIRTMIGFASNAFNQIKADRAFSVAKFNNKDISKMK